MSRTHVRLSEGLDQRKHCFEILHRRFECRNDIPPPHVSLFGHILEPKQEMRSLVLQVITINLLELNILDCVLILPIPLLPEPPDILEVPDLLIDSVKVTWCRVVNLEQVESELHVVPPSSQSFDVFSVFRQNREGFLVCVV
jgi:hypothetical protein